MRNWIPAVPIVGAATVSAALYDRLPSQVHLPLESLSPFGLPGAGADDAMPRLAVAILIPIVATVLWALLAGISRVRGPVTAFPEWFVSEATDARAVARFASTYQTLVVAIVTSLAVLHVAVLGSAIGWPTWTFQLATASLGVAMLVAGNVVPRARPNWIVGIRTKGTLGSAAVWMRTHRLLGAFLMGVGVLVVVASAVTPSYAVLVAGIGLLAALIAAHALGARAGRGDGQPTTVLVALALAALLGAVEGGRDISAAPADVAHAQAAESSSPASQQVPYTDKTIALVPELAPAVVAFLAAGQGKR